MSNQRGVGYNHQFRSQFISQYAPATGSAPQPSAIPEPPKEDATTYYGVSIAGERVISPAFERYPSHLSQHPPILFRLGTTVGISIGTLLFNKNMPINNRQAVSFSVGHVSEIKLKGPNMMTGEKMNVNFQVNRQSRGKTEFRIFSDLASFIAERFVPLALTTDLRTAAKKVVLWESGEKEINPFNDLLLVALEHSPSEHAWYPVFFCRNQK